MVFGKHIVDQATTEQLWAWATIILSAPVFFTYYILTSVANHSALIIRTKIYFEKCYIYPGFQEIMNSKIIMLKQRSILYTINTTICKEDM